MAGASPVKTRFTISGVREIQTAFVLLPARVARKVVNQAIRASLKPMAQAVKARTPRGETGALRASVKVKARAKRKRGTIALDVSSGAGFTGPTYYGGFLNFGTRAHRTTFASKRWRHRAGGIRPRRFMETAFERTRVRAEAEVKARITAGTFQQLKSLLVGGK